MPVAQTPEDLQKLYTDALNAGDIDRLIELYEEQAAYIIGPGQFVAGRPAIREAISDFLALKPHFRIEDSIVLPGGDDLALIQARWTLDGTGPDGAPVQITGTSRELVRPQADGRWLYVIDDKGIGD